MSEGVDTRVRELVRSSSIETREAVFEDLVRELMRVEPDAKSVPLQSESGELLGFFVRPATVGDLPPWTSEDRAEHQRRLDTIDQVIDAEELIRRVNERITRKAPAESASR
jgi:hypothetical protein